MVDKGTLGALAAHALALTLAGCSPPPPVPPSPPPVVAAPPAPIAKPTTGPLRVAIRFTHLGEDRWRAEYTFNRAVRAVGFGHPSIVRTSWHPTTPGDATMEGRFIRAPEPFDRLVVDVATENDQPEKDYRPFYKFTDRGYLVYTGQLALFEATCEGGRCRALADASALPGELAVEAASGEAITLQGQTSVKEATLEPSHQGTFAYFGDVAATTSSGVVGVIDRGLPRWLGDRFARELPRLFAFYEERLGPLAPPTPTLFLTYLARTEGHSVGGGVIPPHVLSLDLELAPPRRTEGNQATLFDLTWLVAHEAAHFWNGDQFAFPDDPSAVWLHEGSADAMALRALHAIGVLDARSYLDALSMAASECALWLTSGKPLVASARANHQRAFYVCGSTLGLLSEAAVRRRDPKADLLTLWRAVFDDALQTAKPGERPSYNPESYARVLRRLGGDEIVATLDALVQKPLASPATALRDAFARVGVVTRELPAPFRLPDEYEARGAVAAMEGLLPSTCTRTLAYTGNFAARATATRDGACEGLSRGEIIARVAGEPLGTRGASAYRAGYEACARSGALPVVTERGRALMLTCATGADLRRPPPYFAFTSDPAAPQGLRARARPAASGASARPAASGASTRPAASGASAQRPMVPR